MAEQKVTRGNASQFFVAGELCRRGYSAVVTLGSTPNTDILCSNLEGTKFVHIQVKTFIPGSRTCNVGRKSEKDYGDNFFWILGGIPLPGSNKAFIYYVIPSSIMKAKITEEFRIWCETPGVQGQQRNQENPVRTVILPPHPSPSKWDLNEYRERWDLIEKKLIP
jgi:hypothetical protein